MKNYIFIIGLMFQYGLIAQSISGKVTNSNTEPLVNASLHWLGTTVGTTTNNKGEFEIKIKNNKNNQLVASHIGYTSDTIIIHNQTKVIFSLKETYTLSEVVVNKQRAGVVIPNYIPFKTEIITSTELRKMACCDLAGCFETQTTVQPQTTNIITNSKELRILGLSGVYNQVLIDGFPMLQGLSNTYGISSIPGSIVDNIYVAKGANSVLQGYESMSGQINVETKDPNNTDKLFINGYINSFSEKHLNLNYAFKKEKWSNLTAFHTVQPANKIDKDHDNFIDVPKLTRYMVFNKWKYGDENEWGFNSKIGLRFLNEQRIGGQTTYSPDINKGSNSIYGQTVTINQPEIWIKSGYRFNDHHSLGLYVSSLFQDQKSYFGTVKYFAQQTGFYGNLQYDMVYSNKNTFKTGLSFRFLNLKEDIDFINSNLNRTYAGNYKKNEKIPGIFAENTLYFLNDQLTWITGVRYDYHNQFGFKLTPRTLLKYDITNKTVLRASVGTGWRTVNLFSENIGLLVSSRDILFQESLKPERATNFGFNITQKFKHKSITGHFSADFYRTDFQNQIFPDYDTDPTKAIIKNYTDKSVGNGFQTEFYLKFLNRFELKTGYNFIEVYHESNGTRKLLPFNPKHKLMTSFSYKPLTNKFHIDVNMHWNGKQRLSDTKSNPPEFQRPDYSKPYSVVNAQFTYNFSQFEIYSGGENIFDFRQKKPIISWQNPFSPYFDTSSVWGPTRGREIYLGLRYKISGNSVFSVNNP